MGKVVRVLVLDDRLVAIAPDGKTLWERKGALTGGVTITADDRLLVASDAKVLAIDPAGHATEIVSAPKEIFLTPPIVTGAGLLVVASGSARPRLRLRVTRRRSRCHFVTLRTARGPLRQRGEAHFLHKQISLDFPRLT